MNATYEAIHRKKVCAAIKKLLEKKMGLSATNEFVPDEAHKNAEQKVKDIDLQFHLGETIYYLEHTLLEGFPEQIQDGHLFSQFFDPLNELLKNKSRNGRFSIYVPPFAANGLKRKQHVILKNIADWIIQNSNKIMSDERRNFIGRPDGVPFDITVGWMQSEFRGVILGRTMPENLPMARGQRIRKALDDKLPKLLKYKEGVRILLLESHDIALGNPVNISDVTVSELSKRSEIPEIVYLIDTDCRWIVWPIKENSKYFPKISPDRYYLDVS